MPCVQCQKWMCVWCCFWHRSRMLFPWCAGRLQMRISAQCALGILGELTFFPLCIAWNNWYIISLLYLASRSIWCLAKPIKISLDLRIIVLRCIFSPVVSCDTVFQILHFISLCAICSWDFIYAEYIMAAGYHHRSIVWQVSFYLYPRLLYYLLPFDGSNSVL